MFRCCVELDVVPPCQSSRFSTCQALAGVDLLSLDGLRAVRCLDSVAFPEARRFLRVAKWVYKAGQMLLRLQVHGVSFEGWRDVSLGVSPLFCAFYLNRSAG